MPYNLKEKKDKLVFYKGGKCFDCGGVFPNCCFQFDHRNPREKLFLLSDFRYKYEDCLSEADKCDLVCANCHDIRTTGNLVIKAIRSAAMTGVPRSEETKGEGK